LIEDCTSERTQNSRSGSCRSQIDGCDSSIDHHRRCQKSRRKQHEAARFEVGVHKCFWAGCGQIRLTPRERSHRQRLICPVFGGLGQAVSRIWQIYFPTNSWLQVRAHEWRDFAIADRFSLYPDESLGGLDQTVWQTVRPQSLAWVLHRCRSRDDRSLP
jgi:hypothetical protein